MERRAPMAGEKRFGTHVTIRSDIGFHDDHAKPEHAGIHSERTRSPAGGHAARETDAGTGRRIPAQRHNSIATPQIEEETGSLLSATNRCLICGQCARATALRFSLSCASDATMSAQMASARVAAEFREASSASSRT